MSKTVYLFELDSTRRSAAEIARGQAALFEELVGNGNAVVLTFNQLVDSPGFLATLRDINGYEAVVRLFSVGALKVSPYGDMRTASQYVQAAVDKEHFIFSALELDRAQPDEQELLVQMARAIRFGDLEALEAAKLWRDTDDWRKKCLGVERLARVILQLNLMDGARNPVRDHPRFSLQDVMGVVLEHQILRAMTHMPEAPGSGVEQLLREIQESATDGEVNQRSWWIERLKLHQHVVERHLGELVVDLCYNYAVEESIADVAKHFRTLGDESFIADFTNRLERNLSDAEADDHHFHSDGVVAPVEDVPPIEARWHAVEWILSAIKISSDSRGTERGAGDATYEETVRADQIAWRRTLRRVLARRMGYLAVYLVFFVALNYGLARLNSLLESYQLRALPVWVYSVLLFAAFAITASAVMRKLKLPDILDSLVDVAMSVQGWVRIKRMRTGIAYKREVGV